MSDAELIEQLRAKVVALRSPRGTSRGHREATDSCSTTSKDSSRLNSGHGNGLARMPGHEADAAIVVNVGGVNYTTTVATLKAVESSYFSLMLNGLWEPARTRGGDIFVDRNGELFGYVLEHLRGQCHREPDTFQLPDDLDTLKALLREAEFYRLPALVSRLSKRKEEMMDAKDRSDTETDIHTGHESIDPVPRVELDIAYSAVSSAHCQFTEEALRDLTMRVNYQILQKGHDGFRVRDVNSRVHLNPNDPMMPYSMTCTAVLVREKNPLESTGRAVASTNNRVRGHSPAPLVLHHHHQPAVGVGRRPSPVHSPRPEIGRYRLEASALVPSDDRLWCHQVTASPTPEPVCDPLQQVTEARLRLQALVAEHASKGSQPCAVGVADDHAASRRSLGGTLDHSMNPPAGAQDASAVNGPLAPRSRGSIYEVANQVGSPLAGLERDASFGVYSGEVRRIMGIPQAPGCQSNPPALMDALEAHGPLESLHAGSESTDMDRDLATPGVCTTQEARGQETGEQGESAIGESAIGESEEQMGLESHACVEEVVVAGNEAGLVSECIESSHEQDCAPEALAAGAATCEMDTGAPAVDMGDGCQVASPDLESPACGAQGPPAVAAAELCSNADLQAEGPQGSASGPSAGALHPPACEQLMDDNAGAQQSDINNEGTEAGGGLASVGQSSGDSSDGNDDVANGSGLADTMTDPSVGGGFSGGDKHVVDVTSLVDTNVGFSTGVQARDDDVTSVGRVGMNEATCDGSTEESNSVVDVWEAQGLAGSRQSADVAPQCSVSHAGPDDDNTGGSHNDDGAEKMHPIVELPSGGMQTAGDAPQIVACQDDANAGDRGHDHDGSGRVAQQMAPELSSEPVIHQPPTPDREATKRQVQPRDVDAPGDVPSLHDSGSLPRGSGAASDRPDTPRVETVEAQKSPMDDGIPRFVPGPSANGCSEVAILRGEPMGSPAPLVHSNAGKEKMPGPARGLPPPSKFSRYQSARQEGATCGDQLGIGPKPAPLFAVPHRSATSPPLLQDRIASKAKARSRIPHLNLAPITAAAGRDRAHIVGRRPGSGEDQLQGASVGGMQKGPGNPAKRSGLVRPSTAASGLTRQTPSAAGQRLGIQGRRPSGSRTTGQR